MITSMVSRALRASWSIVRCRLQVLAAIMCVMAQLTAAPVQAVDLLDGDEDFKLLASLGFEQAVDGAHPEGTRDNDYAWSMAWFKGKLYVGTGNLGVSGVGQIWAYTPGGSDGASGSWSMVHSAPSFLGLPRELGYRWMASCRFRGADYLFVSTIGALQGNILYTSDGVNFRPASRAGVPFATIGFRTISCFAEASGKQLLVISPVGKAGGPFSYDSDESDNPIALANDDPTGGGAWRNYSPLRMGDPDNNAFFSMHAADGWLYAGVGNLVSGAQLWRTSGCTNPRTNCVPNWTKLIDRGGGRPVSSSGVNGNKFVSDIIEFGGSLYLGLSSPALDFELVRAELWRMRPDATFEILVGEPRLNFGPNPNAPPTNPALPSSLRCGLPLEDIDGVDGANDCPPTARRGAGFGDVSNAAGKYPTGSQYYFWRLFNYAYHPTLAPKGDDRLYVGTFQGVGGGQNAPGFDLLASSNGVDFTTVSGDGFGFSQQQGVRSIAATPYGLAIGGTHFPIGNANEIFGANVWLGAPPPDGVAPVTTIASPPSPVEGAALAVRDATFQWSAIDTPAPGSLPLVYATRLDPLEPAFGTFASTATRSYTKLPDGNYTFHVIARDNAGNTESPGAAPGASNRRSFSVAAPNLPPSVSITVAPSSPNTTGNANFAWQGSDDVTPAGALLYDRWLEPLQVDTGSFAAGTTANYTGLADGAYTFHVKAKDGGGTIGAEATAGFTVAVPPGPPAAPLSATATLIAPRVVRIAWTDVAAETSYEVQRCLLTRGCAYANVAVGLASNSTMYDDTIPGVSPPGSYRYQVRACNGLGCSAWVVTVPVLVQ